MNGQVYAMATCGYAAFGLVWSFLRWTRFVNSELDFYEQERQRFMSFHRIRGDEIPDFLRFEWRNVVQANQRLKNVPPLIHEYRGVIAFDFGLWPVSLVVVLLQGLYVALMRIIIAEYKRITESRIQKLRRDLNK
jgi:hypothetical protein